MIMAMIRPETEMKDSGIEWIGIIPSSWTIFPANGVFSEVKEKNMDLKLTNAFSFKYGEIVDKKQVGDVDNNLKETLSSYTIVRKNTIMINGLNLNYDFVSQRVAIVNESGVITSAYLAIQPDENKINPRFVLYLLKSYDYQQVFHGLGSGIRKTLKYQDFKKIMIVAPTLSEQQAIADYLDETCSKIDEIIAEAKASIDEYKELKQSVIFEAVTKGLDKNINVYKTGNSWIPLLPAGVKLSRFGLHHDIILGKMLCPTPRNEEDTLEPYYCAANVHFDGITGELKTMWFNSKEKETYVVHKNDMLIVEGGAGAGGAAIMNEEPPVSTFVQNSIMIVRSHMKDNRYSCYLVQALVKNKYVDVVCNKATIPHFTKEKVSCMPYPVFNRNERNEIANYLDERCKQIDSLISEKESLINDLEAYKKSLIYEVVTGKRRVV